MFLDSHFIHPNPIFLPQPNFLPQPKFYPKYERTVFCRLKHFQILLPVGRDQSTWDGFDFGSANDHVIQLAIVLSHHVHDNYHEQVPIVVDYDHGAHHDRDSYDPDLILERACFLHFGLET